jgi:RNA polymerase sigma factor (sigma-70 family)
MFCRIAPGESKMNPRDTEIGGEATEDLTVVRLSQLSLPTRAERIFEYGQVDLTATVHTLRDDGAIQSSMDANRLAWAVAFNVTGGAESYADTPGASRQGIRCYRDGWPLNTLWKEIWSELTKPLPSPDADKWKRDANSGRAGEQWLQRARSLFKPAARSTSQSTLLSELARSVACEQREDWQRPAAIPLLLDDANFAFESLYSTERPKVTGTIRQRFPRLDSEDIVAEAWARVFVTYWSNQARRRFLGLCRISTLLIRVACNVAVDELGGLNATAITIEPDAGGENGPLQSLLERSAIEDTSNNPEQQLLAKELFRRIKECMGALTSRQRIVAEMVWVRKLKQRCVAVILEMTESNVSQLLKLAEQKVLDCARPQLRV